MSSWFNLPWSRHRQVNELDTARSSSLDMLSSELLLMIAQELPLPDAANLALTNGRLSKVIGPTYWPRLRPDFAIPRHRERFLDGLARDLPAWFYCHSCSLLHSRDRIRPTGPFEGPSNPPWCQRAVGGERSLVPYSRESRCQYSLMFHHLQLAMRRHYLGPGYGISADELAFVQVEEPPGGNESKRRKGRRTTLFSADARVLTEPARLGLRIQRWTVLHTRVLELAVERAKCVGVCHHHNAGEREMSQLITSSLEEHLAGESAEEGVGAPRKPKPKRRICRGCKFVYQLEVLDTDGDGLAIVITQWLDLGAGLTPLDPKWKFRARFTYGDDGIDHAGDSERCRLGFENEDGGLNQHALTRRNASCLSLQQYRKTMDQRYDGEWILQAGRRHNDDRLIIYIICLLVVLWLLCLVISAATKPGPMDT